MPVPPRIRYIILRSFDTLRALDTIRHGINPIEDMRAVHQSSTRTLDAGTVDTWGSMHPMNDSFNADFYVASATVIPVLFLAFAVQSELIKRLRKEIKKFYKKGMRWYRRLLYRSLISAGVAALICGVLGEVLALHTLMQEHDNTIIRGLVFASAIVLLVEVAAVPAFVILGLPYVYIGRRAADRLGERLSDAVEPFLDALNDDSRWDDGFPDDAEPRG